MNNTRIVIQDHKPLIWAHGIRIEEVTGGCVILSYKDRTIHLYPGQTVTVDVGPSVSVAPVLARNEVPQAQKP